MTLSPVESDGNPEISANHEATKLKEAADVNQTPLQETVLPFEVKSRNVKVGCSRPPHRNDHESNLPSPGESPKCCPRGGTKKMVLDGFPDLLACLDPDPAMAWQAYEELRKKLRAYFENNHLFDSDELADKVLDRIAARADVDSLKNLVEFAFGVARTLRKEHLRQSSHRVDVPALELIQDTHHGEDAETATINNIEAKRKLECFRNCMQSLLPEERDLIGRYFPAETCNLEKERQKLATCLGISAGALRTRVARIREKLEEEFDRAYHRRARVAVNPIRATIEMVDSIQKGKIDL